MKKISEITRNVVQIAVLGIFLFAPASLFAAGLVKQSIDTTDAMATLENFDRGFYTPQVLHLKPSGGKARNAIRCAA